MLPDRRTVMLSAAFCFLFTNISFEQAYAADDVWRIDYFAGQLTAPSWVFLSKDAIQICTLGSYEITAKAPDWTATVVNKRLKKYCVLPAAKWKKDGFFLDRTESEEYLDPKKAATDTKLNFRGLAARRLTWNTMESDAYYRHRAAPEKCVIELIETDKVIPCTKMQLELLSAWYGIPYLTGVPLHWQNILTKEKKIRLKSKNICKVPASSVTFKPAGGCAQQKSMMQLVENKYANAMMDFAEFEGELIQKPKKPGGK